MKKTSLLVAVLTGTTAVGSETGEPIVGGRLAIGAVGGVAPLNPIVTKSTISAGLMDVIFDVFVQQTETGEIAPGIAISWSSSDGYRVWDFEIRQDVTFHDGSQLTAEDVVFTFEMIEAHRPASWPGGRRLVWDRVSAPGPYQVRFEFAEAPGASLLYQMREHIVPKPIVQAELNRGRSMTELDFNRMPTGSGPFRVTGSDDASVSLEANVSYAGGRPLLDEVEMLAGYADVEALWSGFMRGEVDLVMTATPEDARAAEQMEEVEVISAAGSGYIELWPNCRPESPLADARVREAVDKALDRETIWEILGGAAGTKGGTVVSVFMPGSIWEGSAAEARRRSAVAAPALLQRAGWEEGAVGEPRKRDGEPLKLTLLMPKEYPHMDNLAAQLRRDLDQIGVRLVVSMVPFAELGDPEKLGVMQWDLILGGSILHADPDQAVSRWHSSDGRNRSGFSSAEVDSLIELGRTAYGRQGREAVYKKLASVLTASAAAMPLVRFPYRFGVRRGVEGTELLGSRGLRALPQLWLVDSHN